MIGIFPPFLDPDRQTIPDLLNGSNIAGNEFAKNMLRWLPVGSVDLFVHESRVDMSKRSLARFDENEGGNYRSARVWDIKAMPSVLRSQTFMALHTIKGPWLNQLSYIRSQFADRLFPITCLTHGFSYQDAL